MSMTINQKSSRKRIHNFHWITEEAPMEMMTLGKPLTSHGHSRAAKDIIPLSKDVKVSMERKVYYPNNQQNRVAARR